jgi:uncharacterized protein
MAGRVILFAPGAGAPSSSRWMQGWVSRLSSLGDVVTFDYPYMQRGSKRPDPQATLVAAHRHALEDARKKRDAPLVLAGKSMGSRMGCHVALEERVSALVCFGYPLQAAGNPDKLRDQVLLELALPILFVQGTKDPLCPLERLDDVRRRMSAVNELHVVEGGDHSLNVAKTALKAAGTTQADVDGVALGAVAGFLERYAHA